MFTLNPVKLKVGLITIIGTLAANLSYAQDTQLYWGDTHVHTSWSSDAYQVGNTFTGPDEAYLYAKGAPVIHTRLGTRVQIKRPLDFMVVGDHAENMRRQIDIRDGIPLLRDLPGYASALEFLKGPNTMGDLIGVDPDFQEALLGPEVRLYGWQLQVDAAERHNEPGTFTTFAGWEWTRNPGGNQHRIIFTSAGPDATKQFIPYSTNDGMEPEDLWGFLDSTSSSLDIDFVSMPHNSNLSNSMMFRMDDSQGRPIDAAYARTRARWEPVMEITQVKGTSEVHPELSPDDEFADFEIHGDLLIGGQAIPNEGDYARTALMRGLALEEQTGINPFKLGFIGSTDSHTGLSAVEEDDFLGKTVRDALPSERAENSQEGYFHAWEMSASGIAAVWAEENSRNSIFESFKRREVYGTSGTRISLRMFGGFRFRERDASINNLVEAGYAKGVPMGGDLTAAPRNQSVGILIHAVKDPMGANLDRVQVIKGWLDADGRQHEKVFNALWSDDRELGNDGELAPVGNTVDVETARYTNSIGSVQLIGFWQDPEFDASQRAFYYLRALEIPTPRHSTYDTAALRIDVAETLQPATIQERAWSSPIWYTPSN